MNPLSRIAGVVIVGLTLTSSSIFAQTGRLSRTTSAGWSMSLSGATSTTQVSGTAAQGTPLTGAAGTVLTAIQGTEQSDRPCQIEATFTSFDLDASGRPDGLRSDRVRNGSCRANSPLDVTARQGDAVVGLQVCQRSQNGRLKGVRIRARTLGPNGSATSERVFERPNCNQWGPWVECAGDQVATGLVLHWRDVAVVGLALQCRNIAWSAVSAPRRAGAMVPPSLNLTGSSGGTGTTGTAATTAVLSAPAGMALRSLTYGERNDSPCFLEARFESEDSNGGTVRTFNQCGGNAGSRRTVAIPTTAANLQFASTVTVCQRRQNERLKGIRLRGSRVDAQGATFDQAIVAQDERPNCNQWGEQVFCPAGDVITAVQVHHRPRAGRPTEITGLAVTCATATLR
jgi:hypothetical protein